MATTMPAPTKVHPSNGSAAPVPVPTVPDISGKLMTISPAMASELLAKKVPNRPLVKSRIRQMILDLRAGRWIINGETLVLTADLEVIDGQHRLMACRESGIALTTMVVIGVSPAAQSSIDQGARRSLSDTLAIDGVSHVKQLSAACQWTWRYLNNSMRRTVTGLRNGDIAGFVAQHPGLPAALEWGRSVQALIPAGAGSMLFYTMAQRDAGLAKQVFRSLATGLELSSSDLIWVARERFLKERAIRTHAVVVNRCAVLVLAWNRLRQPGSGTGGLIWKGMQDVSVAFPTVL